ncbi:class I SAM-dependent rRNA methyltransferase [Hydrogenothermus marinus]|uniref:23S rRNA (Cytosine1962-C5)-methyltransferase n=1 Tax=Hydrogenothermus marinus TaxID=133270 RepID=A0A3M0C262_9AQUI|nr:class I SAM-dependent rRNA methyltransferase [Hydrogenothermus marinus]RMA97042.1 23S rRNA (cytosine1962-C5)-methyltransferase [Hydrogenothermus marinus]
MKKVILNKEGLKKIKLLNPSIYKKEIKKFPVLKVEKGELVEVFSEKKKFVGIGYLNPESKISLRILTFEKENIDKQFFEKRIKRAIEKRKSLENITNSYRIIHSEADFLPGLIVDKYSDYISVQFNTAGIYIFKEEIVSLLIDILKPRGIYYVPDVDIVKIENIPSKREIIYGEIPDEIIIEENNIKFSTSIKAGQKTGFFLDQRRNRKIVSDYIKKGDKVLDLFSNVGGFGIYCYKKGASFVHFVDISKLAVSKIEKNCQLNNVKNYKITTRDAFKFLTEEKENYDFIIIDPPSFAKNKAQIENAIKGYQYLLINSIKLLNKEGYIAIFTCSHHISEEHLKRVLLFAAEKTKKYITVVEHLYQDIDHPYVINIPNSLYLRGFLVKVE